MEVNDFEILLVDVTFRLCFIMFNHVQKLVFNVIIPPPHAHEDYNRDRWLKG